MNKNEKFELTKIINLSKDEMFDFGNKRLNELDLRDILRYVRSRSYFNKNRILASMVLNLIIKMGNIKQKTHGYNKNSKSNDNGVVLSKSTKYYISKMKKKKSHIIEPIEEKVEQSNSCEFIFEDEITKKDEDVSFDVNDFE